MPADWTLVEREHVEKACRLFDAGDELPTRPAKNTFLIVDQRAYPAKFILGVAYRLATGKTLNPSTEYSGGLETARRLQSLGFEVQYDPESTKQ